MTAQERADQAAKELAKAVAEMAGPEDGEMVIIVRSTSDGSLTSRGQVSTDLLWTWDWFWRPKTDKPEPTASG